MRVCASRDITTCITDGGEAHIFRHARDRFGGDDAPVAVAVGEPVVSVAVQPGALFALGVSGAVYTSSAAATSAEEDVLLARAGSLRTMFNPRRVTTLVASSKNVFAISAALAPMGLGRAPPSLAADLGKMVDDIAAGCGAGSPFAW